MFFSEEKNQKTFLISRAEHPDSKRTIGLRGEIKVFCFFSSEKKGFLP
jgi:hypothetical protein